LRGQAHGHWSHRGATEKHILHFRPVAFARSDPLIEASLSCRPQAPAHRS
jgi:hypothetical protein